MKSVYANKVRIAHSIIEEIRNPSISSENQKLNRKISRQQRSRRHQLLGEAVERLISCGRIKQSKIMQELDNLLISKADRDLFDLSPKSK